MNDTNGSHVTWRELRLLIDPIKEAVNETRSDVKLLLQAHAGDEAVSSWQRWFFGAVFVSGLGAVATLVWLAVGG